jgi:hypothetical protein
LGEKYGFLLTGDAFDGNDTVQSANNVQQQPNQGAPPLSVYLMDPQNLPFFIKHVVRELSVENLFFLADVMNFKRAFLHTNKLKTIDNGFSCQIPEQLARYMYRSDRTLVEYAVAITRNYIDGTSANYVTAIDQDTRQRLLEYMYKQDPDAELENKMSVVDYEELSECFDRAAREVYSVVKQAYFRFSRTDDFKIKLNARDPVRKMTVEVEKALKERETES